MVCWLAPGCRSHSSHLRAALRGYPKSTALLHAPGTGLDPQLPCGVPREEVCGSGQLPRGSPSTSSPWQRCCSWALRRTGSSQAAWGCDVCQGTRFPLWASIGGEQICGEASMSHLLFPLVSLEDPLYMKQLRVWFCLTCNS